MKLKENKTIPSKKIIEGIKKEIKSIWKLYYNKYSRENNVEKFHDIFSINNSITKKTIPI